MAPKQCQGMHGHAMAACMQKYKAAQHLNLQDLSYTVMQPQWTLVHQDATYTHQPIHMTTTSGYVG